MLLEVHGALGLVERVRHLLPHDLRPELYKPSMRIKEVRETIINLINQRHVGADGQIYSSYQVIEEGSLVRNKHSRLDTQVLMSSVFLNRWWDHDGERVFPPSDPHMRATFHKLRQSFEAKYAVNREALDTKSGEKLRGLVFGRYPEDSQHFNGAPWFITTFAAIQFILWDAIDISRRQVIEISNVDLPYFESFGVDLSKLSAALSAHPGAKVILPASEPLFGNLVEALIRFAKESFFRVMVHAGEVEEPGLTEVLNMNTGFKEGIQHLTWSYVEAEKTIRLIEQAQTRVGLPLYVNLPENTTCEFILAPVEAQKILKNRRALETRAKRNLVGTAGLEPTTSTL